MLYFTLNIVISLNLDAEVLAVVPHKYLTSFVDDEEYIATYASFLPPVNSDVLAILPFPVDQPHTVGAVCIVDVVISVV